MRIVYPEHMKACAFSTMINHFTIDQYNQLRLKFNYSLVSSETNHVAEMLFGIDK